MAPVAAGRKRKSPDAPDERTPKVARTDPGPADPFDPTREINPSIIPKGFSPLSWISGTIGVTWPLNSKKVKKLLLRIHEGRKLEVLVTICSGNMGVMEGVAAGNEVRFSLDGAECVSLEGGGADGTKLPFALTYPKGALMKVRDRFIDTRKPPPGEWDWFHTPSQPGTPEEESQSPPLDDGDDYMRQSPITEVINDRDTPAQASASDVFGSVATISQPASVSTSARRPHSPDTPKAVQAVASTSTSTSTSISAPNPTESTASTNASAPEKRKRKRVRKRDTRHANNPALQAAQAESSKPTPPGQAGSSGQAKLQEKMQKIERKVEEIAATKTPKPPEKRGSPSKRAGGVKEVKPKAGFMNSSGTLFSALDDLKENQRCHVAGIVVRADLPKQTRSGDWMVTYSITDPTLFPDRELSINFFRDRKDALPTAKMEEALLIKQLKIVSLNDKVAAVGYKDAFIWAAYEPTHGKEYTSPFMGMKMDQAELRYCLELVDWWREKCGGGQDEASPGETSIIQLARRRRALVELKDMQDSVFCDCLIQVVKVWQDNRTTDLYVTDYTENPGFGDPKQSSHNLPARQPIAIPNSFVCKITLWDEVNSRAEVIQPGQFFKLKNIRVRYGRGGNLEGSMGMGKDGREAMVRLAESDESLRALRKRKIAFLKGDVEALSRTTSANDLPQLHPTRGLSPVPDIPPAEHCTVSQMKQGGFYTFVAEVLKVWRSVNLDDYYVTDYTEHPYLWDFHNADVTWSPPPGRRSLQVSVFDGRYRAQAAEMTPGCFVRFEYMLFRKVHPKKKLGDGKEEPPLMAGKIGEIVKRPCSIKVIPPTDPEVKTLLKRKASVLKVHIDIPATPTPAKANQAASLSQRSHENRTTGLPSPSPTQPRTEWSISPSPSRTRGVRLRASEENVLLTSIFHNMPHSSFATVKAATTSDVWKVRARVVAFQPGRLREWVWQECPSCHMEVPVNQRTCSECMDELDDDVQEIVPVPRWRFAFVLQDEQGEALPNVFCCDDAATIFLGDLPPQNLVSHRETLKTLRERITPLLGTLEAHQLHLLKAEEEHQRRLSGSSSKGKGKAVKLEEGSEEREEKVKLGGWGDWTIKGWKEGGQMRYGVFGCRVVC